MISIYIMYCLMALGVFSLFKIAKDILYKSVTVVSGTVDIALQLLILWLLYLVFMTLMG